MKVIRAGRLYRKDEHASQQTLARRAGICYTKLTYALGGCLLSVDQFFIVRGTAQGSHLPHYAVENGKFMPLPHVGHGKLSESPMRFLLKRFASMNEAESFVHNYDARSDPLRVRSIIIEPADDELLQSLSNSFPRSNDRAR